jgi:hypothetical protein
MLRRRLHGGQFPDAFWQGLRMRGEQAFRWTEGLLSVVISTLLNTILLPSPKRFPYDFSVRWQRNPTRTASYFRGMGPPMGARAGCPVINQVENGKIWQVRSWPSGSASSYHKMDHRDRCFCIVGGVLDLPRGSTSHEQSSKNVHHST